MTAQSTHRYDVALSFAGENRPYVADVAAALSKAGVKVFYDEYEKATLWGKDLYTHLTYVYQKAASYTIVFVSEHYAKKLWSNHELRSAQARALEENREYILPARFDKAELPGLLPTTGYIDLKTTKPDELAVIFLEKLGQGSIARAQAVVNQDAVLALIVKVQSRQTALAECIAEALVVARGANDQDLTTFCTNELIGYPLESTEAEQLAQTWRHMNLSCTLGKIDVEAMGFSGPVSRDRRQSIPRLIL